MIKLTNEEYKAIMEAREELAMNEMKADIANQYAARRAKELNSNKAGHGIEVNGNKAKFKSNWRSDSRDKDHKAELRYNSYKNDEDNISSGKQEKWAKKIDRKNADNEILRHKLNRDANGNKNVDRALNSNDRKRNRKAVKEAVLDWYDENGYEIDDYEMGRIDQFVESYYEDEDDE